MKLTENFTKAEFERSETAARHGWDNTIPTSYVNNVVNLCHVLEIIRERLNELFIDRRVIRITSGYRNEKLNKQVGGVENSQHTKGEAADFIVPGVPADHVYEIIKRDIDHLLIDQCILEFGQWIHLSTKLDGNNRQEFIEYEREDS